MWKFLQQIITIEFEVLNEKRMIEVFNQNCSNVIFNDISKYKQYYSNGILIVVKLSDYSISIKLRKNKYWYKN